MSHIHTESGQHDHTASAFIVRLDRPEPTVILHVHKLLKIYLQFGGHVELHENPWQAITHEIAEESGYSMKQLKILQPKRRLKSLSDAVMHPYPVLIMTHKFPGLNHYHSDTAYGFVTRQSPAGRVGKGESAELKEFTAKQLRAIPTGEIPENVRETALFVLEECLKNWVAVEASEIAA